jgi:hypothetical protein
MALMRSGQKGLDEIQRIRAAMESGSPIITEAQRELIKKNAALLGEDGDAIIQDIQAEAEAEGPLPADIFKIIEGCCQDLNKRVASLERSNEVVRERETERLTQIEAMREQVTRFTGAKAKGDNAGLMRVKLALGDICNGEVYEGRGQGRGGWTGSRRGRDVERPGVCCRERGGRILRTLR